MFHQLFILALPGLISWQRGKLFISHAMALGQDSIHIILGVALWIVAAALSRRPLTALLPWMCVLGLTVWDQAVDLMLEQGPARSAQYAHGAKALLLMMLVPTALIISARLRPELFRGTAPARSRRRG